MQRLGEKEFAHRSVAEAKVFIARPHQQRRIAKVLQEQFEPGQRVLGAGAPLQFSQGRLGLDLAREPVIEVGIGDFVEPFDMKMQRELGKQKLLVE